MKLIASLAAAAAVAFTTPTGPVFAQDNPLTDAVIENFLQRKPEAIMVAMQRAQEKQQLARNQELSATVGPVANSVMAGDKLVPVLGNPRGTIQIVEFYDYNCGFCKKASQETITPLLAKNPKVKVLMVMLPILGPGSVRMAEFAAAAHLQGKFVAAHNFLMKQHASSADDANKLIGELIAAAGLDKAAFDRALANGSAKAIVDHGSELGRKASIGGTPTFYFNGRTVPGAIPLPDLEAGLPRT